MDKVKVQVKVKNAKFRKKNAKFREKKKTFSHFVFYTRNAKKYETFGDKIILE